MQIILNEKIRHLGNLGDKVDVKRGYARNFLIPQKKAVMATEQNLLRFEAQRAELEKKAAAQLMQAQQRAAKLEDLVLAIHAMASEEGKLYGSIGTHEIKEALDKQGHDIHKNEIDLPHGAFHEVGEYTVNLLLHSDVAIELKLNIMSNK